MASSRLIYDALQSVKGVGQSIASAVSVVKNLIPSSSSAKLDFNEKYDPKNENQKSAIEAQIQLLNVYSQEVFQKDKTNMGGGAVAYIVLKAIGFFPYFIDVAAVAVVLGYFTVEPNRINKIDQYHKQVAHVIDIFNWCTKENDKAMLMKNDTFCKMLETLSSHIFSRKELRLEGFYNEEMMPTRFAKLLAKLPQTDREGGLYNRAHGLFSEVWNSVNRAVYAYDSSQKKGPDPQQDSDHQQVKKFSR